jgi:hypothetical protein
MEVTKETLIKSIRGMSDEVLLKRWASGMFTEDALPIATEEIRVRGLDTSQEALLRAELREKELAEDLRKRQFSKVGRGCLRVVLVLITFAVAVILKMLMPIVFR